MIVDEIKITQDTYDKLKLVGYLDESLDNIIDRLISEHEEIKKYIQLYIEKANGKCINEKILGTNVIANHHFDSDNICKKCGIQAPKIMEQDAMVIEIK